MAAAGGGRSRWPRRWPAAEGGQESGRRRKVAEEGGWPQEVAEVGGRGKWPAPKGKEAVKTVWEEGIMGASIKYAPVGL